MTFLDTPLKGVFVIHLEPKSDERGFFARAWCEEELAAHGLETRVAQASISYNRCRGTLRGLHYRVGPHAEARVVRCIRGAMYDVVVDLRPTSASHLQWFGVTLTSDNRKSVYIPEGCAHGFQTLEDDTEVLYLMSKLHKPEAERGLRWDDGAIAIVWPHVETRIMSEKDRNWPLLTGSTVPPFGYRPASEDSVMLDDTVKEKR